VVVVVVHLLLQPLLPPLEALWERGLA